MKKAKKFLVIAMITVMASAFGIVTCQTESSAKKVTISLNKKKCTLQVGKTVKLKASVKPSKKKKKVTFKTSNKKVATVSKKGVVKGKKAGKATITAKIKGTKKKATCKVTVKKKTTPKPPVTPSIAPPVNPSVAVTSVSLDKTALTMCAGRTETLTADVAPANATNKTIVWSSSDSKTATVNNGVVTAVSKGSATITATNPASGKSASCSVTVKDEIVITSQSELNEALANDKIASITIQTDGAQTFTIPEGNHNSVSLTFNAPNAQLVNGGDFESVTICGGSYEQTAGWNDCTILNNASVKIGENASAGITVTEPATQVSITNDGTLASVNVYSASKVKISGAGEDLIPLNVTREANIVTNQPVKASATAKITLSLLGGAEESSVSVDTVANKPEIRGVGYIEVSYKDGTTTETVVPGALDPEDAVKVNVTGNIKDAYNTNSAISGVQVFLVTDSVDLDLDSTASQIASNESAVSTVTDADGNYYFETIPIGNYCLIAKKDGYKTAIQRFTVSDNSGDTFTNETLYLLDESRSDNNSASVSGCVKNATNNDIVAGLTVNLFLHKGNTIGTPLATTTTDSEGNYQFTGLSANQYTIQVLGNDEFISNRKNVCITADSTIEQDILVSPKLSGNGVRFVLTWGNSDSGAPEDLDAHLTGPTENGGQFEIFYSNKVYGVEGKIFAQLDVDDTDYEGPETITLENTIDGIYTLYIDNYSKDPTFASSSAQVNVYRGSELISTYNAPTGTTDDIWKVCTYNSVTGRIRGINKYISEDDYSNEVPNPVHGMLYSILDVTTGDDSLIGYELNYKNDDDITHLELQLYAYGTDVDINNIKDKLQFTLADEAYTYDIIVRDSQEWNERYASTPYEDTYCKAILEIHKSDTETICYEVYYN